ncbi:MAG TPA: NAD(P)/FAD-dependent oxidoreductase [Flavobacterium sp.]|jgi:thioredoxin reductase|uniref:NAD(P)/FAD-dependent oxidoreductase n=1 Tax=Flavobacterium sp. TaxID=239 RepID=UPI002CEE4996|nr:NAD(P)/FAD-dependent oxidoreductase [Flavobacterium sp.]MCA0349276.1 NAD(P)/FAD-dependent oxidoreductase [Bacteroidota bacterium]HPW97677.1 NAD(P)/FAD-dependent oxidoreductase [Flavobacterium sp.]HQA73352.1 NAD(P)/FAD-dependent oxidoreductase [Flavobacterium sp.]
MFDVLIIGGGVSSMSCAYILGSGFQKPFASDKKIGIIAHQKTSSLQNAIFNNAYGIPSGKLGAELLIESIQHLQENYPHVLQIKDEKVLKIEGIPGDFIVTTNKQNYAAKIIVLGIGASNPFTIEGLAQYIIPHKKANPEKNKIQLQNDDHLVTTGIYACGTLAGHRSQLTIAAGSGAAVATDILSLWNDGIHVQVHDSVGK